MATRRILKHYNVRNISGEDIDLTIIDRLDQSHTILFEKDEVIHGIYPSTAEKMRRADPSLFRFIRLEAVYEKELIDTVNWRQEGF